MNLIVHYYLKSIPTLRSSKQRVKKEGASTEDAPC